MRKNLNPGWHRQPAKPLVGHGQAKEFAGDLFRDHHAAEEIEQELFVLDAAQIENDRSVRDDDHRGGNSRKAARSCSRSA